MASKEYYKLWLEIKKYLKTTVEMDEELQALFDRGEGLKPQRFAVTTVGSLYGRYCCLFNMLCECYDLMTQVQRRTFIKNLVDTVTCRILELKNELQEVESFEYTYPDNAMVQMLMIPHDIKVLCPFFYSFETRKKELQFIVDEIMSGNRLGDPEPTASELERQEQEKLELELQLEEERKAELKRLEALGMVADEKEEIIELTSEEIEALERHKTICMIQAMEKARSVTRMTYRKTHKGEMLYLDLAGLKKPTASPSLQNKAANFVQSILRSYMKYKREQFIENKLLLKLDMIELPYKPPSAKFQLEEVKSQRRIYREKFFAKWMNESKKEEARILQFHKDDWIEDITDLVRGWLEEWYNQLGLFDEYPWPDEGGSILIVRGDTMTVPEYKEWVVEEAKRVKEEKEHPKSKEEIKAEKLAAKEEAKQARLDKAARDLKLEIDYQKQRLKPDTDPGVKLKPANTIRALKTALFDYDLNWSSVDDDDPPLEVIQGFIHEMITEIKCQEVWLKMHPLADEIMIPQYQALKNALKMDFLAVDIKEMPLTQKRPKPKKGRKGGKSKSKRSIESMFQELTDQGIIIKPPTLKLDDFWGDPNYAAADLRAIPWLPKFPPPCQGDVREEVRVKCLLALGSHCPNVQRTILLAGPVSSGKRTLVYALATETNSVLFDLSPKNIYNKYLGPKPLKVMNTLVTKVASTMEPAIILINDVDKIFYKKVPKEERDFDPTRLAKSLKKEVIAPLKHSKVLIIGTASEPWLAKTPQLKACFPSVILVPRSDYGSLCVVLYNILMKYHKIDRDFDYQTVSQIARGYSIGVVRKALDKLLTTERFCKFNHDPLDPKEILWQILNEPTPQTSAEDYVSYSDWYTQYSGWANRFKDYSFMLETQYAFKLKAEKKKP